MGAEPQALLRQTQLRVALGISGFTALTSCGLLGRVLIHLVRRHSEKDLDLEVTSGAGDECSDSDDENDSIVIEATKPKPKPLDFLTKPRVAVQKHEAHHDHG